MLRDYGRMDFYKCPLNVCRTAGAVAAFTVTHMSMTHEQTHIIRRVVLGSFLGTV